ncbi:peptidase C1 [candidate division KSB1 bacterium]|nr:peptidase C1 [candidate division KSB1 bacterium]
MRRLSFILLTLAVMSAHAADKPRDKTIYRTEADFYGKEKSILRFDVSRFSVKSPDAYRPVYHTVPVRQDTTGTCWCFSATSLLESEIKRLSGREIALSRMFTVYWEYVEKVRRFVREKGNSLIAEGSQHNAVIERMKQYGAVRAGDYSGRLDDQHPYNQERLIEELKGYLDYIAKEEIWNEDQVITATRLILNKVMGAPPDSIQVDGEWMTPRQYLEEDLQLPLDDYVSLISFRHLPYWTQDAYKVPDNWWNSKDYYNVPLDDFYMTIKSAIQKGISVAIAGDVSEPGRTGEADLAVVPTFDIPSEYIDSHSREFRFDNGSSADDHGVHLIGYTEITGEDWFLIKDSSTTAFKGRYPGYFFFHGDYIKLKILAILLHKDGAEKVIQEYQMRAAKR